MARRRVAPEVEPERAVVSRDDVRDRFDVFCHRCGAGPLRNGDVVCSPIRECLKSASTREKKND